MKVIVASALCEPVYSPAIRLCLHLNATPRPAVASVAVPPVKVNRSLASGQGRHSYLPVSPPALIVVQVAFVYAKNSPPLPPANRQRPSSGSTGEAVVNVWSEPSLAPPALTATMRK
ncbi:MAG TPA: hypothetical protein VED41_11075 [Solirubrobacteraceae bacterium]|nr:hypothetical protein [Solirubrobacteraceae bacterium]